MRFGVACVRSSSPASPASASQLTTNPRKDLRVKPRSGAAGGAGSGDGGRGGRSWTPKTISLLTLSGAVPWPVVGESTRPTPTVCHGLKGSLRLTIELRLGSAAALGDDLDGAGLVKKGPGSAVARGDAGSHDAGTWMDACFHPGYDCGLVPDPVGVLAEALVKLHEELAAQGMEQQGEHRGPRSLCVDEAVMGRYKRMMQEESARREGEPGDLPQGESHLERVRREWFRPALCLRRICGVVGAHPRPSAEAACALCEHERAFGLAASPSTPPSSLALPPPISRSSRADVELLVSHMQAVEPLVAAVQAFVAEEVARELARAENSEARFQVEVRCSDAFSPVLLPPSNRHLQDACAEPSPDDEDPAESRAVRACHDALQHAYSRGAAQDDESDDTGHAPTNSRACASASVLHPGCIPVVVRARVLSCRSGWMNVGVQRRGAGRGKCRRRRGSERCVAGQGARCRGRYRD